jgi:hypothetical protein
LLSCRNPGTGQKRSLGLRKLIEAGTPHTIITPNTIKSLFNAIVNVVANRRLPIAKVLKEVKQQ